MRQTEFYKVEELKEHFFKVRPLKKSLENGIKGLISNAKLGSCCIIMRVPWSLFHLEVPCVLEWSVSEHVWSSLALTAMDRSALESMNEGVYLSNAMSICTAEQDKEADRQTDRELHVPTHPHTAIQCTPERSHILRNDRSSLRTQQEMEHFCLHYTITSQAG